MRICIVSPNFPQMSWSCGAADFVEKYAQNLAKQNHEVTVLTANPNAIRKQPGVQVEVIAGTWNLFRLWKLSSWLNKRRFDLIDVQYESAMYQHSLCPLLLPFFLNGKATKRVLTLHSRDLPKWGGRIWRLLQFRPYDSVIFYSKPLFDRMSAIFKTQNKKFHLLGFPSNIRNFLSPAFQQMFVKLKAQWPKEGLLAIYFGNIAQKRGIEDILQSLLDLKAKGIAPQLALMSNFNPSENPYHQHLLDWIDEHGLSDQVSFTDRLEEKEVSLMLQASDVCILPFPDGASFKNGSLSAAIQHGVPTITTVSEITEEALLAHDALLTYKLGDQKALSSHLEQLILDEQKRNSVRSRTLLMKDLFSWDGYIKKRLEIYANA